MFAIIRTGGKQYKVQKDDIIQVDKIDAEAGKSVDLKDVLFVTDGKKATLGAPLVQGASVKAEVLEQKKDKKIIVFKKKRRQNYRRKNGHRQEITILKVTDIKTAA